MSAYPMQRHLGCDVCPIAIRKKGVGWQTEQCSWHIANDAGLRWYPSWDINLANSKTNTYKHRCELVHRVFFLLEWGIERILYNLITLGFSTWNWVFGATITYHFQHFVVTLSTVQLVNYNWFDLSNGMMLLYQMIFQCKWFKGDKYDPLIQWHRVAMCYWMNCVIWSHQWVNIIVEARGDWSDIVALFESMFCCFFYFYFIMFLFVPWFFR